MGLIEYVDGADGATGSLDDTGDTLRLGATAGGIAATSGDPGSGGGVADAATFGSTGAIGTAAGLTGIDTGSASVARETYVSDDVRICSSPFSVLSTNLDHSCFQFSNWIYYACRTAGADCCYEKLR